MLRSCEAWPRGALRALAAVLLGAAAFGAADTARAEAQELTTALGIAGGLVSGAYVTTGLYVLRSRTTGWVLHSPADLLAARPEALPIVAAPIAGAVLGYRSPGKLSAAAAWGGVGFVSGGAIGVGLGHLIWGGSEGRWAGLTIGSALGLLIGAVAGAVDRTDDDDPAEQVSAPYLTFAIPFGGRR